MSRYFFYKFWSFLCTFAIVPTNNVALIKSSSSVSLDAVFVAAAFDLVAERATLRNKFRSKVAQQKSGVSSV